MNLVLIIECVTGKYFEKYHTFCFFQYKNKGPMLNPLIFSVQKKVVGKYITPVKI